ncbi:MAG: hypothetical protein H0W89_01420 [Candidatus Levybacteria bacterium]|nr:hypothetical protein [Candidatus Levybacteria bacterium]
MDKTTLQKLKDAIGRSNSIGIAVGREPSIDEMGAALALYLLLKNANKKVSVASPTDPIVEISSLVGINKVARKFGGDAGDLVVSFPYQEGEIEKVSYTLENNFLNIIVKASEQGLSFDEKDVNYTRGSGTIDLLITIGAAQLDDVSDVFDAQKLSDVSVINIDNQPNNQGYGDIVLVAPQASSVSEHVADIVLTLGFSIEQDAAQNLLSGIMYSTKNFQDPKTSSLAFEVSAFLMKRGALRVSGQQPSRYDQPQQENVPARPAPRPAPAPQPRPAPEAQAPVPAPARPQPQPAPTPAPQTQAPAPAPKEEQPQDDAPPLDWLTPKVYKGSSEV